MERNRGKCCPQSIIVEMFLSPSAYGASPPLSLSPVPDSLYAPPFLCGESLVSGPPVRGESSGRRYARERSRGGSGVPGSRLRAEGAACQHRDGRGWR